MVREEEREYALFTGNFLRAVAIGLGVAIGFLGGTVFGAYFGVRDMLPPVGDLGHFQNFFFFTSIVERRGGLQMDKSEQPGRAGNLA